MVHRVRKDLKGCRLQTPPMWDQNGALHGKKMKTMKALLNFTKTMLMMPIHWQVWLGMLVTANIILPIFFH